MNKVLGKFSQLREWFTERVYPAPVAPFVTMIAQALIERPENFKVSVDIASSIITVRLDDTCDLGGMDAEFVNNGVGLDLNMEQGTVAIVTYYFDAVPLNWREEALVFESVGAILTHPKNVAVLADGVQLTQEVAA